MADVEENRCSIEGCPNLAGEQTVTVRFQVDGHKLESAELRVCPAHYEELFVELNVSIDG